MPDHSATGIKGYEMLIKLLLRRELEFDPKQEIKGLIQESVQPLEALLPVRIASLDYIVSLIE